MRRSGDRASRGSRADNFAVPAERGFQLHADFKVVLTVQVNGDMTTCPWNLQRPDDGPYRASSLRNDPREFLRSRATAHHRKQATADLFESDVVFHQPHLCRRTTD
jgi:hypothetical protein